MKNEWRIYFDCYIKIKRAMVNNKFVRDLSTQRPPYYASNFKSDREMTLKTVN